MRFYLIRHGEALHNLADDVRLFDPELTEKGLEQCRECEARKLDDVGMVVSSTATRTLQTSLGIFGEDRGVPFYATDLLLEYNTGVACNKRYELEVQKERFSNVDFDKYKVKPLDIELTWNDGVVRAKRIVELLHKIKMDLDNNMNNMNNIAIAVVSHQNILRNVIFEMTGNNISIPNCGYYVIEL